MFGAQDSMQRLEQEGAEEGIGGRPHAEFQHLAAAVVAKWMSPRQS